MAQEATGLAEQAGRKSSVGTLVVVGIGCAVLMLVLDLVFLGVVAQEFYADQLGSLRAKTPYWPAALAFYALYLVAIMVHAVLPAQTVRAAALKGAGLGLVAYGTWDLTNWAVIQDWPGALVPVDMTWGILLTSIVSAFGRLLLERRAGRA